MSKQTHFDTIIIGAGILGLAQACMAARRHQRVLVIDQGHVASGATVRNFGMIWPIGQPAGELHAVSLRSRELWLDVAVQSGLPIEPCGSIHLATRDDELSVMEEFVAQGSHGARMASRTEILDKAPLVNRKTLVGGMFSDTELRVDPRVAAATIAGWLQASSSVEFLWGTKATSAADGQVHAGDGRCWYADRIVICSGSDLQTLYPQHLTQSGLRLCKLQMLQAQLAKPLADQHPHLAGGLTLRHYTSFRGCSGLQALEQRIKQETPELEKYGIHVLVSIFPDGRIILGDSHEYDHDITPFDKPEIDTLILRELKKLMHLDDWTVTERWHGIYAKHPDQAVIAQALPGGVHLFVGAGGAGMTMSFGLAERTWNAWEGKTS